MHRPVSIVYPPPVWVYPAVLSVFFAGLISSTRRIGRTAGSSERMIMDMVDTLILAALLLILATGYLQTIQRSH